MQPGTRRILTTGGRASGEKSNVPDIALTTGAGVVLTTGSGVVLTSGS